MENNINTDSKEAIKTLSEIIESPNVKYLIEQIFADRNKTTEKELLWEKESNSFAYKRYYQDIILIAIILISLLVLTFFSKLEPCTIGTLLGTIVGYALGRLKKKNS